MQTIIAWKFPWLSPGRFESVCFKHIFWHAIPNTGFIAYITDIFHANLAGEKARSGEVAHEVEKRHALCHLRFRFSRIGNLINQLQLRCAFALHKSVAVSPLA